MRSEFNVYINNSIEKVFLYDFFSPSKNMTSIIHRHKYAEIHIIKGGSITFRAENSIKTLNSNQAFAIPATTYHCYLNSEATVQSFAFQTTANVSKFSTVTLSEAIMSELYEAAALSKQSNTCGKLSSLISYIGADFFTENAVKFQEIKDPAVIIYEIISKNYNKDLKISDIAKELFLSEKQTERIIKKQLGDNFKSSLCKHRIKIADFLEKNTSMNLNEIAEYVGYSTYSGFWKARQVQDKSDLSKDGSN